METTRNHIRIAQLSARLIVEEGIDNYAVAKRKASERLGLDWRKFLPDDDSVTAALQEYHRIFRFQQQDEFIHHLRMTALQAMEFLGMFSPRLIGTVLEGTAGEHNPIILNLYPDTPEEVIWKLVETNVRFREAPDLVIRCHGKKMEIPVLTFQWNTRLIEVRLYLPHARKQIARNAVPSATIKALRRMLKKG